MKYVIGVDLGTSAVKILLVNQNGEVCREVSKSYPLIIEKSGYSEQNPEEWVEKTTEGLAELLEQFDGDANEIEGISFSGQMHGLVLLDENHQVLRNAILWNDTRTTKQCEEIYSVVGKERLLEVTKNPALEGFTLPKILWVKENEPQLFERARTFLLPKDYLRYRITKKIQMEYSDAAGTLLLNVAERQWSHEILDAFGLSPEFCPPLVESHEFVGTVTAGFAEATGLTEGTKVFAGGADNACGAIGSGILSEGKSLCSIGTSGVVLSYEERNDLDFAGKVHYFNHGEENAYYTMGVTLAAGYSLSWFKDTFAKEEAFDQFLAGVDEVSAGSNGLLFTPYIVGERTPHANSAIRGSFIGIDASHERKHFARAVLEGITFSLNESIEIFRSSGKTIDSIISIGGGAKNETWLQMQADIFNAKIEKLASEQGPGMGAAMLAAYGCGWFPSLKDCAKAFIQVSKTYEPIPENVEQYKKLFLIYQDVYTQTKTLNDQLREFRR
ncbi:xylulokinase [Mesobacillus selenatarsenatis]|uniref:Xylulose kinase n=1 Tax=Mesobacillus selenatarsenatis (strain DSM 18680 / JCM 14380 / FERM P-15431 / SF-1) TaxID=1321606 RepID=A0A0A8X8M9_MESS1|nr:xylulokinase [Mesobacillus selenatarsenatis]GAM16273.1 xylulose kinase [Mesobacillus selenatarsenatis SF-1]